LLTVIWTDWGIGGPVWRVDQGKEGLLFWKKRSKKLFLNWATGVETGTGPNDQSFFASFLFTKKKTLHYLALPCLTLPCLALPYLALPCLTLPCLALPCLALPCLALPCSRPLPSA
jgi:hypothetical protein